MDKKLFNDGLKTLDSELGRVKRQQLHWKQGHNMDKRKLFLSLNAAMLTLKFLTNEAKKEFEKEHENESN